MRTSGVQGGGGSQRFREVKNFKSSGVQGGRGSQGSIRWRILRVQSGGGSQEFRGSGRWRISVDSERWRTSRVQGFREVEDLTVNGDFQTRTGMKEFSKLNAAMFLFNCI